MPNEDSMTVDGNAGSGVHWGGGSGNGNGGGSGSGSSGGANVALGGVMEVDLGNGLTMIVEGTHPINPGIGGVPWADAKTNKSASDALKASKNKPAKYKANIKNWQEGNKGTLDRPSVSKILEKGDITAFAVRFGKEIYQVRYNRKTDTFSTGYAEGTTSNPDYLMNDQAVAVVQLYLLDQKQKEVITTSAEIIVDAGEKISGKLGSKYKVMAQGVANDIRNFQGKKIRTFKEAMASLEAITKNPNMKLSQADKTALVNALNHVNLSTLADRFKGLERAFTWADRLLKAQKIKDGAIIGITTGNWQPLALEVEAMYLSGIAGSVALGIVTALISGLASLVSIPAVAITALTVMAVIGIAIATSYISPDKAKELNNAVAGLFK
ncbi:TPA: colicin-like pore-forming protein [Enterobacter cloacae]